MVDRGEKPDSPIPNNQRRTKQPIQLSWPLLTTAKNNHCLQTTEAELTGSVWFRGFCAEAEEPMHDLQMWQGTVTGRSKYEHRPTVELARTNDNAPQSEPPSNHQNRLRLLRTNPNNYCMFWCMCKTFVSQGLWGDRYSLDESTAHITGGVSSSLQLKLRVDLGFHHQLQLLQV